ncbi:lysis protein [Janthinobacterium sp. GW460P]|uniref:lysis system i-spanin subunit Rz n=2 Tax=Janthinobacterium TaxID=29580 RepID=UPI00111BE545|nr:MULTISPECIES: lysis system i-spanin subunit Rz [unclassified Janthinobacterium]MCC7701421.1 lysis protein [Janthinobacterium sp. GW460P]MCC7706928.1 lysis protein [Janthinobacterium sp. GW460W]
MAAPPWRALAVGLLAGAVLGWTTQGWRNDAVLADVRRTAATAEATAAAALVQATGRVLLLERAAGGQLATRTDQLTEDNHHAQTDRDRFMADVRSGAIRLSIPVAGYRPGTGADPADSAAAGVDRQQARAELDGAAAAALDAIAGDGDAATRQLNACIDAYNLVRDTYHVQTE